MSLDPDLARLARGKNFAALTTLMSDGQPQTQIMWVDADDDALVINTEVGRQKFRNVEADPRVTVTIFDSDCFASQCSILFAVALVVSMLVPNGSWISTSNSGRSEFGKNCFFTTAMPPAAMRKVANTIPATVYFLLTHQVTSRRKRRYPGVE